ncbi:MAG TPA: 30S ribosomal protein S6 [Rhodospirillaceae bacterium]|nr:30S ribosomal protein S6 [Rhodospirillaceae bacterium]
MSLYECVFIARQDIATTQVDSLIDEFANLITAQGGQVTKREYWGLRNIAYRVKKNRKGHYVMFNLDAPSSAVKEFERQMSINEDILRYLTVRVEQLEEGPSAVMQSKNQRDDRPPRRDGEDRPRREGGFGRDGGGYGREGGFSRPPRALDGDVA